MKLTLLAINAVPAALMLLAAYSPYISPVHHATLSCFGLTFPIFATINMLFLFFWIVAQQYKYAMFPLFTFIICHSQLSLSLPLNCFAPEAPSHSIKLLSFNVMGFDGCAENEQGQNGILNYLKRSDADIICLQEYMTDPRKGYVGQNDVERALADYPYHHICAVGSAKGQLNRMACYSKHPIIATRPIAYESQYNGSVQIDIRMDTDTLTVINNHLESNKLTHHDKATYAGLIDAPEKEQMKQGVRLLARKLAEASRLRALQADSVASRVKLLRARHPQRPIVVCGDFNDTPISYAHRVAGTGLTDAFQQSGHGLGISYHRNRFYFRIDHILLSPALRSYECIVDRSIKQSDHYPIWCYLAKVK